MVQRIQARRGTASEWSTANPVLSAAEPGVETTAAPETPEKLKFGDGVTPWNSLPYFPGDLTSSIPAGTYGKAVEVDDFLTTSPTPAQTLSGIQAAVAAAGNTRPLRFTPGRTYLTSNTFTVGTGAYIIAHGATIAADPAGSGHYLIRNATESGGGNPDITIEGGTWDPRGDVLIANGSWLGHGLYFRNVDRLRLSRIKVQKALKWAILVADADDIDVRDITFDTLSDGLHCHAPMKRPRIYNVRGITGDDMLAFTTNDYPGFATSVGDFEDIEVDGLYPAGSVTACAMLGDPGHSFKGTTTIRNLKGTVTTVAVRVVNDPVVLTATTVESLTLSHVAVSNGNYAGPIVNFNAASVRDVLIEDIVHTNTSLVVLVNTDGVVNSLLIKGLRSPNSAEQPLVQVLGRCDELIFDGVTAVLGSTQGKIFQHNGVMSRVVMNNIFASGGAYIFQQNAGVTAIDVFINNCLFRNFGYGHLVGATCNFFIDNVKWLTIANYLFNLNNTAAAVRILAGVVTQVSVTLPVALTGSATISANGEMLLMDATGGNQINAAQAGDRVRDRITGKPVLYNGSAWVAAY